jgi:hypothetical protein
LTEMSARSAVRARSGLQRLSAPAPGTMQIRPRLVHLHHRLRRRCQARSPRRCFTVTRDPKQ